MKAHLDADVMWTDGAGYLRHGDDRYAHRTTVERLLGKELPPSAVVHHVDGNRANNGPDNLVVCPDQKYHLLLHARQRIVDAGGNPDLDKVCGRCGSLKSKDGFPRTKRSWDGRGNECSACANARRRGRPELSRWTAKRAEQQRRRRERASTY